MSCTSAAKLYFMQQLLKIEVPRGEPPRSRRAAARSRLPLKGPMAFDRGARDSCSFSWDRRQCVETIHKARG
jgi:hypothetical protein